MMDSLFRNCTRYFAQRLPCTLLRCGSDCCIIRPSLRRWRLVSRNHILRATTSIQRQCENNIPSFAIFTQHLRHINVSSSSSRMFILFSIFHRNVQHYRPSSAHSNILFPSTHLQRPLKPLSISSATMSSQVDYYGSTPSAALLKQWNREDHPELYDGSRNDSLTVSSQRLQATSHENQETAKHESHHHSLSEVIKTGFDTIKVVVKGAAHITKPVRDEVVSSNRL
jgi:hypothetical protein